MIFRRLCVTLRLGGSRLFQATFVSVVTVLGATPALADGTVPPSPVGSFDLVRMGEAVFAAFVLAVVLESALALIFNWRPFARLVDGRGMKTIISFALSCVVVWQVNLNLLQQFRLASHDPETVPTPDFVGLILTAMIVAGGSSGVNTLLVALGFRSATRAEEVIVKPPSECAWLAVRLIRSAPPAAPPVRVLLSTDDGGFALVGTILGLQSPRGFLRWFLQDSTRFPTVAGYSVPGGHKYAIKLEWDDVGLTPLHDITWGPFLVAKGAVIDVALKL